MRYDTLLLDLDGTLIDSRADIAAALNHVRAELFDLPPQPVNLVSTFVGDGSRKLIERSLPDLPDEHDRALAAFLVRYAEVPVAQTVAYPGVPETLARLTEAGVKLGVVTNKATAISKQCLAHLDLARHIGAVHGGDTPRDLKPEPYGIIATMETLGGVREKTLMVGDSRADVLGARNAKIDAAGVLYGIGDPKLIRALKPEYLLESFYALWAVAAGT